MARMRRPLIAFVLLAILGAAAFTLWQWDRDQVERADPWRAVPAEAAIVLEVPDAFAAWDRFTHASLVWRAWESDSAAVRLARVMAHAAKRMEGDAALRDALAGSPVIVAVMRVGQAGAAPLVIGRAQGEADLHALAGLLALDEASRNAFSEGRPTPVRVEGVDLSAAARSGLWLASPSSQLLDEALLQLERGRPIASDSLFAKARATLSGHDEPHLLVETRRLAGLLSDIWEARQVESLALPAGWMAFDVRMKPDALILSGLFAGAQDSPLIRGLLEQGAGPWSVARMLPASVSSLHVRHIGDADALVASMAGQDDRSRAAEAATPWMLGPVGEALALGPERRWLIAGAVDPDRAQEELMEPCAGAPCDTIGYRGIRLTRYPSFLPKETLMGRPAPLPQQPWWAILGSHVVMSDDPDAVRSSIDAWLDGGSLAEEPAAKAWFKEMADEAGFTWWCDPGREAAHFRSGLRADAEPTFNRLVGLLSHHSALSIQASGAPDGMLHVAVGLRARSQAGRADSSTSAALWSVKLDAPVARRPDIVLNHVNGTREVLVQDTLHRIHLFGASGKLLWSRALEGPIVGGVHQVDRFRNGKLQLLLATARTAYLIDRNGNDVGGPPHALPSPVAAPMAVVDYEGRREYRVLVPLQDRRILNLDLDWAPVQGWEPPRLAHPAIAPVRHLRIGGKDYLLVLDEAGGVRLLDRRGKDRLHVTATLERPKRLVAVLPGQEALRTRLIWLDQDLRLRCASLSGEEQPLPDGLAQDLDGDGAPEWVMPLEVPTAAELLAALGNGAAPPAVAALDASRTDSLAIGELDAATGDAWRWVRAAVPWPGHTHAPHAMGDLNLDGLPEAVTVTPDGRLTTFRLP